MLYIFNDLDKLDDDFPESVMYLLSEQRRMKVRRIQSSAGKKASAVVYLLLRCALKSLYGIDRIVDFEYVKNGKPVLKDYPQIHFSLSHTQNAAACVVADIPAGVDVQQIKPISDKVAKRVLTVEEFKNFKDSVTPDEYFCEMWTIKESFLKQSGKGIAVEMREISAGSISDKMVFKGKDYFCCISGQNAQMMQIKHVGREDFEPLCD